ncbi:MAG: hypothetical protein OSJ43_13775 [Oscillospiraceae bacterium]|nr:hypothetical protein [Oscillospiraceae bacterium]
MTNNFINRIKAVLVLIAAANNDMTAASSSVAVIEDQIAKRHEGNERLTAENRENLKRFAKLARALDMSDVSNKMPMLNGSSGWSPVFHLYFEVRENGTPVDLFGYV